LFHISVNFHDVEAAVSAQNALNGREFLGKEIGPIRVGYARVSPSNSHAQGGSPLPNHHSASFANDQGGSSSTEARLNRQGGAPMTQENVSHIESYGNDLVRDLINKTSPDLDRGEATIAEPQEQGPGAGVLAEGDVNEQQMLMSVLSQGDPHLASDVQAVGSK
jgi:protein JSN1